jgi:TolB-like protein
MRRTTATRLAAAAIGTALLCACSGPTRFVDPEADLPYYETVAIVPFTTLAQDRAAGLRVTDVFYGELLRRDFALVLEPGQFDAAMRKVRGGTSVTNPWSQAELSRLGEETGIQGIFMGTVRDYEMVREGRKSFPLVCLEARLVDTGTGRVVWSASDTQKGGPGFPILGFGETHTLGEMTAKVCQDLLSTLP